MFCAVGRPAITVAAKVCGASRWNAKRASRNAARGMTTVLITEATTISPRPDPGASGFLPTSDMPNAISTMGIAAPPMRRKGS
ncbi:hypothetical protein BC477_10145 [Clavibacter michiganensis subsp. michiganensis]|uniref:Uncharacterized protein n=1 Tax=Clavibacter michiganensis subsp. michiganensis TaxID=33013 RepID=A0A251XPV1_CLAMM|nr:hypothetical protein BC477_10145 [Clavibacter michiganensis subsp. michiganensis]OUE05088.1 hypothetical protein CMMCAS07_09065 [Clavibacter michiganensis subsp. michiganensis]